jgi:uncharacterized protein (TIGR03790 family)
MSKVTNVVVIATRRSPDSGSIARYYAEKRGLPPTHLCLIDCTPQEEVSLTDYRDTIETPVYEHLRKYNLTLSVDYLVLTKGVPIRIREGGFSVDSALMCAPLKLPFLREQGRVHQNPYFGVAEPFSRRRYGFHLATRLDGYLIAHIKSLVDNSLKAKRADGIFVLDIDPRRDTGGYKMINDSMRQAATILKKRGFEVLLDERNDFVGAVREIMGYYSWGSNDGSFNTASYRSLQFRPGAIAETAVSTSARTFNYTQGGQSLIADLIAQGVTGVKGYVSEPFAVALCRAHLLFDHYTRGRNLAESFWSATPFLQWKDVVVGDPLCAPYSLGSR